MRFTLAWLKEYLDFQSSVEELCEKLTSIGLEVEDCKNTKKNLDNFIVSQVEDINQHPNADKLKVCDVNDGNEILKIVCGASNVKKKMKTVLAKVGSKIMVGTENEFKIGKSVIRGVESNGMLCSEEELNLSEVSEGIIELDNDCKVGDQFSNYLSDENIEIEIAITPNRGDCAGVYGIARDLSASGFGVLKEKKIKPIKNKFQSSIKVFNKLKDQGCPQFLLREIKNVKNTQSPDFMKKRFKGSGLKVISSLVDVTNYLTRDFCRPLHVFDSDKIEGNIEIRYSKKGEQFQGLDDVNYILDEKMIVICDENKIISLAGVMGGKNSSCDNDTKNILIESAYFSPNKIAYAGRKLNIISDARYRFERGIDTNSAFDGIELATGMIIKNCGGEVGSIVSDSISTPKNPYIEINIDFINQILGYEINKKVIENKLLKIGCDLKIEKKVFKVSPPSWRSDIKIKEDLVEEVGRLTGYENVPSTEFKLQKLIESDVTSDSQKLKRKIKEVLVSRNIMETISWSFANKKWEESLKNSNELYEIENPINSELSCLRTNLVGGLLNLINKNNNKNIQNISVFEMGPIFQGIRPGEQADHLTLIRSGKAIEKNWIMKSRDFDIFDLKTDLFSVFEILKLQSDKMKITDEKKNYYHPGKNGCFMLGNKKIASFGELHPSIAKKFKIKNVTCLFELYLSDILKFYKKKSVSRDKFISSSYQASIRDFSFDVDKKLSSIELVNYIKEIDKEIILDVRVFDNYENKDVRSLALEVIMQSGNKTLTENEINNLSEKIINQAKSKFKAVLR